MSVAMRRMRHHNSVGRRWLSLRGVSGLGFGCCLCAGTRVRVGRSGGGVGGISRRKLVGRDRRDAATGGRPFGGGCGGRRGRGPSATLRGRSRSGLLTIMKRERGVTGDVVGAGMDGEGDGGEVDAPTSAWLLYDCKNGHRLQRLARLGERHSTRSVADRNYLHSFTYAVPGEDCLLAPALRSAPFSSRLSDSCHRLRQNSQWIASAFSATRSLWFWLQTLALTVGDNYSTGKEYRCTAKLCVVDVHAGLRSNVRSLDRQTTADVCTRSRARAGGSAYGSAFLFERSTVYSPSRHTYEMFITHHDSCRHG